MYKANNYCSITKEDNEFIVTRRIIPVYGGYNFISPIRLEFQKKVEDVELLDHAIITTNSDSTHDLYLCLTASPFLSHFLSNIESYQYYKGVFLLKMKGFYILLPNTNFLETTDIVDVKEKMPILFCETAYLQSNFNSYSTVIYNADGIDYLVPSWSPCFSSRKFDLMPVEILPEIQGYKLITENGQYILVCGMFKSKAYANIVPFSSEDYPPTYSNAHYGYWFKDKNGDIMGFIILNPNSPFDCKLLVQKPIRTISFIRTNEDCRKTKIDIWKIVYTDNQQQLCCFVRNFDAHNEYFFINEKDWNF